MILFDPVQHKVPELSVPAHIAFAGNPVILKLCSTLIPSDEIRFLRICVSVHVEFQIPAFTTSDAVRQQDFSLSIPTDGNLQIVVFNLSAYLCAMLNQRSFQAWRQGTPQSIGYLLYTVKAWEQYLTETNELISEASVKVTGTGYDSFIAIPGRYTPMQRRFYTPEAVDTYFGPIGRLSAKPLGNGTTEAGEVVPEGGKIVFGVWSEKAEQIPIFIDEAETGFSFDCQKGNGVAAVVDGYPLATKSGNKQTALSPGKYRLSMHADDSDRFILFSFTVIPTPKRKPLYFEFVNRFGVLESIYCYGRKALSHSIESEVYTRYPQKDFVPDVSALRHVSGSSTVFTTSTGPVSRNWANWFCEEFFKAERMFMYSEEWQFMIPVTISTEEDIEVYDESEAAVIDLEFTVTPLLEGYSVGR